MKSINKSENLFITPENTRNLVGKNLISIIGILGEYSSIEQCLLTKNIYYIWILPSKRIKLEFNNINICTRIIEESKIEQTSWFYEFVKTPIFLTLFAGLVSIGVGYSWEYFKFKRQTVFEKRIDLILSSRKQVEDIYIEFDRLIRQIRSYEYKFKEQNNCNDQNYTSQIEEIKLLGLRVNYIDEFSKGVISNSELTTNINEFEKANVDYIKCLNSKSSCEICTDKFNQPLKLLNKIIELHTSEINSQIE